MARRDTARGMSQENVEVVRRAYQAFGSLSFTLRLRDPAGILHAEVPSVVKEELKCPI